jgi:hypothetical protein
LGRSNAEKEAFVFRIPTSIVATVLAVIVCSSSWATDPPAGVRPGALFVKDSQGKVLGTYLGEAGEANAANVARVIGSRTAWFQTTPQFDDPGGTVIGFDGPNCTGTPYVGVQNKHTMASYAQPVGAGPRLYYQTGPAQTAPPLISIMISTTEPDCALQGSPPPSIFIPPSGCCYNCTGGCTSSTNRAPAAMEDLSDFVPPLHVGP